MRFKLLTLILIGLMISGGQTVPAHAFLFSNPLIDRPAQDFTLYTLDGKKTSLTAQRGDQKAIVFFWATWCPYCRQAITHMTQRQSDFKDQGIELLMVNVGEDKSTVSRYMSQISMSNAPVFLDTDGAISGQYQVQGLPTFVFVNQEGVVVDVGHQLPDNLAQIFQKS